MNGRGALRIVLAGLCVATWVGCGTEPGAFTIVQNQVPQSGCVVPASRGDLYRGEGRLDVSLVGDQAVAGYRLYPLLQNNLRAIGRNNEPNRLAIRGFRVRIEGADLPAVQNVFNASGNLLEYEEPWSGSVDPGGGLLAGATTAFPAELARKVRASKALESKTFSRLWVAVTAIGEKSDGSAVESDEFRFPLRICDGCLVASVLPCPAAPRTLGHACNVAQDEPVDCCVSDNRLFCPSITAVGR